jgi:putative membrane protein
VGEKVEKKIGNALWKKSLGIGTAVVLGLTACGVDNSSDKENVDKTSGNTQGETKSQKDNDTKEQSSEKQSDEEKDKTETVYAKADADGTVNEVTVNTVLKNKNEKKIQDYSNLTDIKNIKGDEEYTRQSDGTILWDNQGEDIEYEGKSSEPLPVTVQISYFLDDKEVSPKELAGKSGSLKIRFDYENHTKEETNVNGKKVELPVPFAAISALLLSEDNATNIEVKNGKVISLDGQNLIIGYACPGLAKNLNLSDSELTKDIELPEYVEVTADVTDFELDFTATVFSSGLLSDLDEENLDDLDETSDNMDKIQEASGKLKDGSGKLLDGMKTYDEYMKQYLSGVDSLKEGVDALKSGMQVLNENKTALGSGAQALTDGLCQFSNSLSAISFGNVSGQSGVDFSGVENAMVALVADGQKLNTALTQLQTQLQTVENFVTEAVTYQTTVQNDVEAVKNTLGAIDWDAIENDAKAQREAQIDSAVEAALNETMQETSLSEEEQEILKEGLKSSLETQLKENDKDTELTKEAREKTEEAVQILLSIPALDIPDLSVDISALPAILTDMQAQMQALGEAAELLGGLPEQMQTLQEGMETIQKAAEQLAKGSSQLNTGISAFSDGIGQLYVGGQNLSEGTDQLSSAGSALDSGYQALIDGMKALDEGFAEFDKEAIQKLTDLAGDDLTNLTTKIRGLKKVDAEYQNFGGIYEGQSGSVRFIIETEEIKK